MLSVAPIEIFAAKTVAFLNRTAPRDLYDMHNMIKYGLFDGSEQKIFRKCVVFYSAIGAERPPDRFVFDNIGDITQMEIKRALSPVLRTKEKFNLQTAKDEVSKYLQQILLPTEREQIFWKDFQVLSGISI